MARDRRAARAAPLAASVAGLLLVLTGCAGPVALGQQVLAYDEVTKTLEEKLLLLNIARVANGESVHFTATSSIAATFDWTSTVGLGGQVNAGPQANFLNLNIGASASENPTFSILPVAGEEFTKRVVTPFQDGTFEFLVFQGGRIDRVMRLMAGGIEVQTPAGAFVRFIENDPRRPGEYEEFRRLAMHLQWLNGHRRLFVRALVFEETLIADFAGVPRAEDINNGFDKGLRWRQKPDGHYELTRLATGRVVVSNFDPMALSNGERFALNERIKQNPQGFVYLDLRPEGPGSAWSIRGAIKLRSMLQILIFLANGIATAPEFAVAPDARTGSVEREPAATLAISVTDSAPVARVPVVAYAGRYYAIRDTLWDRTVFAMLSILFQTTVGTIQNVGIPITISK
jgi:hypothetical protein